MQVAAAHARRLDLENHVSGAWCRIGEFPELQFPIPEKYDAFHGFLRCLSVWVIFWVTVRLALSRTLLNVGERGGFTF